MKTVTTHFNRIIVKQNQMGYGFPSLLRPPTEKIQLENAEKKVGFRFNSELIELYTFADGISIDHEVPSGKIGLIPIHQFLSLSEAVDTYQMQKFQLGFHELFKEWDTGFQPGEKLFPFLTDGCGNFYWVDLNEATPGYGKVYWTNTYPSSPGYVFNSLTSMFKTIADAYEEGVFILDSEGYLDEVSGKWESIAKINNPGLVFWNNRD